MQIRAAWRIGMPKNNRFWVSVFLAVLQGTSAIALLATSAWLISRAAEQPPVMYLMIAVVGVRAFALSRAALRYAERLMSHNAVLHSIGGKRAQLFEKLVPFSPAGIAIERNGETMARVVVDVDELQALPLRVVSPLIQSLAVPIIAVVVLFLVLPSAAIALSLFLLVAFATSIPISFLIASRSDRLTAVTRGELAADSLEFIENQELLKAYGWNELLLQRIGNTDSKLTRLANKTAASSGTGSAIFSLSSTIASVVIAALGASAVATGEQPPAMLAVFALAPLAVFDVAALAQPTASTFNKYFRSAERVGALLGRDLPRELRIKSGVEMITKFESLELLDISVAYPNGSNVLNHFNLRLEAGQSLALQGSSGSGKSTIANVLLRFLNPHSGTYKVNQVEVTKFDSDSVRRTIGLVEQSPTIFLGTVKTNLIFAKPDSSDEDLIKVLEDVGLWSTFEAREGLNTQLGDKGVLISGGEAQRLALARAILADFKCIILDEPTANVDRARSDELVSEMLNIARVNERSVILITHDARLASFANRTVTLTSAS